MAKLTLVTDDASRQIDITPGFSVREILDAAGVRIRSGCRGNGACGLCLVRIEKGEANGLTKNELLLLAADQIEQNTRLACQLTAEGDLTIRIVNGASGSGWRVLPPSRFSPAFSNPIPSADGESEKAACNSYGLAVDLGTTHISASLWDLKRRERVSGRAGLNPQYCYGSDVVTRLIAAGESPENARKLAWMPLYAVNQALLDMCSQNGANPQMVTRVSLVGNTAMLALLTEKDPHVLLDPRYWARPIDCEQFKPGDRLSILGIYPEAGVEIIPPFAGFVGSDLMAGVLAAGLTERTGGMLIDFGTNSEIALWDGNKLWVTSAAGGPAFEGCGIQCGMPAEKGAVYRVERKPDSADFLLGVIGGGEVRGICGSGLVDLIACLRGTGELTATGKLSVSNSKEGVVVQREPLIRLTHKDIDIFQRAKAAIGVGIKTLLAAAGMSAAELNRICVCGAFGEHLNVCNAQQIGLLPVTSPELVELCGNTALAGCERLLLSAAGAEEMGLLRRRAVLRNLSQLSDFEDLFLESLYLQPLRAD